jgi:hypothetical protein
MSGELSARELEFLRESNAIEEIENIDYADPANAQPGSGHVGAFLDMREVAARQRPVGLDDICRWQRWITEEQTRFGHKMPNRGVGVLRGDDAPYNVRVGMHFAPEYPKVARLMEVWIRDLGARFALPEARRGEMLFVADLVGEFFQRFEGIHPFVDGNGRVGRLVANCLTLSLGQMLIVFRASERTDFYAAHRNKPAMKLFIANKMREVVISPFTGEMLYRVGGDLAADIMENANHADRWVVERHFMLPTLLEWQRQADEKDRARGLLR